MTGSRGRSVFCALLMLWQSHAWAADDDRVRFAGRPVVEVLRELRDPGLDFIFSSELVPATLRVLSEPTAQNRLVIAREVLAQHGLALSVVRPGLYAVIPMARVQVNPVIRGRLLDSDSGAPVSTARVVLLPIGTVAWSGSDGRFSIGPVPQGDYTLRVEATGFEPAEWPEFAATPVSTTPDLQLTPAQSHLGEVVVATSRYAVDRSGSFGMVQIGGEMLEIQPAIGEDALRTLGRLPGIAQNGVSAQSSVRGGEPGELLTLLDGFPLRQAFHMPGYQSVFGVIDPGLVEDAEIYTGGFPVRYGNRMSGVFDLRTIDAASEPSSALGLSVFNATARHGGGLARLNADWLGSVRVGTLRPIIEAIGDGATSPTYADVYTRVGFSSADQLRVSANLLWTRDELSIVREGHGERAQIESLNRYLWLRADRDWHNGIHVAFWLGHSAVDGFRTGGIDKPDIGVGTVSDRRSSEYQELRGRIAWQPLPQHWFDGGIEWTDENARYRYSANATYTEVVADLFSRDALVARSIDLSPDRERVALFASHRWQVRDFLTSELGLRAQRTLTRGTEAESWLLDPRLGLRWLISPATNLRAHWGRFHQSDEVHELKVEDGLTAFPEAQRSDHFIVGLEHQLQGGPALRVEWFRKVQSESRPHFENLLDPLTVLPEIAPDRTLVAPAATEAAGAEFSVVSDGPDAWWSLSVAWSDVKDSVDGRNVPRSWDQTWAVTAGLGWTHGNWRFDAVGGAHRGWPTTRIRESELGVRNAERFPERVTLDLRAEHRRPLAIGSLALTFELSNAINIGNACCYKLIASDQGDGDVTFTTRTSDWLPLVPSISVLWEF